MQEWADRPVYGHGGFVGTAGERLPAMTAVNGVAAEEKSLRYFRRVFGICVWMPAVHLEPGEVIVPSWPVAGQVRVARWPASTGTQEDAALLAGLAESWSPAGIPVSHPDDVAPGTGEVVAAPLDAALARAALRDGLRPGGYSAAQLAELLGIGAGLRQDS